ncbi:unnamed protein product [Mytilus coruscus]|uniref:Uncharacterized protein n=1 Tax=Mytilus coruscus TaxID=42192 RepID=A0A6J8CGH8_MYTCO|nr:unnamed protein product [Mytilus coruscus]
MGHRPENACKTLVCSLVTSRLDYGNALLHNVNSSTIARLQRVQNTAARLITRKRKFDSITPVMMQLHLLPVQYRSHFKLLLYVFKALHDKAPKYLEELIVPYAPIRTLRSENEGLITKPRDVRTKIYGESDSTELELHCGMTYQFIYGKNNRFLVLKKV